MLKAKAILLVMDQENLNQERRLGSLDLKGDEMVH